MNFLTWLAWRLPGNVTTVTARKGMQKQNLNRTMWGWMKWQIEQARRWMA